MTSPDMHTLAGAYALDALTEHEQAQFERHLRECASCEQEVAELRATAARLGEAVAEQPPPELKEQVLERVRNTRQDSPGPSTPAHARERRSTGVPRWAMGIAVAAAVIGLALAGVFGGMALQGQDELTTAQQQLAELRERSGTLDTLLRAPDTRITHGESSIGGTATVVYSPSQDMMLFLAEGLPEQPQGSDYQLWMLTPGHAEPAPVLPEDGGETVMLLKDVEDPDQLGLTVEPEGGSRTPSTDPVLALQV